MFVPGDGQLYFPSTIFHPSVMENIIYGYIENTICKLSVRNYNDNIDIGVTDSEAAITGSIRKNFPN